MELTMASLLITSLSALILGTLYLGLIVQVILMRRDRCIGFGDGQDKQMRGALRAQVNAGEQIPIFLILLGLVETQGLPGLWLGLMALTFFIGRLLHGYGMSHLVHRLRIIGTALNLSAFLLILLSLLYGLVFEVGAS